MIYVIVSIMLVVVAALAYSLGRDKGIEIGRMQVLEEDMARMDKNPCMDKQMTDMVNNLLKEI